MANTFKLIASATVTGSPADISITNIPQTYTDLYVVLSAIARTTANPNSLVMFANGYAQTSPTYTALRGNGSSVSSFNGTITFAGDITNITNTYSSQNIYIPNYTTSGTKTASVDSVTENNGTTAYSMLVANRFVVAAAITSLQFGDGSAGSGLGVGSQVWVYGIKNS
jgi:hypothetical protein